MTTVQHGLMPKLLPIEVKAIVRHRDGYRCVECGLTSMESIAEFGRNLDVHRIVPGSEYHPDGCVTLCKRCHKDKPKSPRGSRKDIKRYFLLSLPQSLYDGIIRLAERERRRPSQIMQFAVEEYLARHELWPPPPPPSPD